MIACTCMVPTLARPWSGTIVCTPVRTMVPKIPALAPGYRKEHRSGCRGEFQDHGSEGVQTMVRDHGFARVGTMQVQAIMPPLSGFGGCSPETKNRKTRVLLDVPPER